MDYSQLNFGAPAAERDILVGLDKYFIDTGAYQRLSKGEKSIVLGNRGSGKSAIFKYLAKTERSQGTLIIELAPEDYSYEMLTRTMIPESKGAWVKHGAFSAAWKYLILVQVMKALTKQGNKFKTGSSAAVYKYLRDNHGGVASNPIATLISYLKRLEGFKVGSYEAAIKTKELEKLYRLEEISPLLPALQDMLRRRKVIVLIDELDRGWDASEDAQAFVAGLFQAAVSLNTTYAPRMRVLMSLRQELYASIPSLYEDAQKVRDVIETIAWDEGSLLELVAKRIAFSLRLGGTNPSSHWATVFSDTLDYRQAKSFNYIVDRTLYRPRELILFCSEANEANREARKWPIDYEIIAAAERRYSPDRVRDIASEFRFQYPGIYNVFEAFRGRTHSLTREELEEICLEMVSGEYILPKDAAWVTSQEPEYLIDALYQIGFLKPQAVGGIKAVRQSGSAYVGVHQAPGINLKNIPRFQIHPMFRVHLGLKESKSKG